MLKLKSLFQRLTRRESIQDEETVSAPLMQDSDAPRIDNYEEYPEDALNRESFARWRFVDKEEFFNYCKRFAFVSVWVILLVVNYCLGRLYVRWEFPSDAEEDLDAYDVYNSINNLLLYGLVLAWFAGITETTRALWIFNSRRWYFFVLFFAVNPIYSWVSNAEGLQHSFEDVEDWGAAMWIAIILAAAVISVVVIWHLYFAWKSHSTYGLLVYVFSRVIVILYYSIFAVTMRDTHHSDVHLHHYFTSWMAALFAEFNHPISAALLGTMSSVFVQGISAYGFDPLFYDEKCVSISTEDPVKCYFSSTEDYTMHMCPGKHDDVALKCYKTSRFPTYPFYP